MIRTIVITVILFTFLCSIKLCADNGAIAYAYPMNHVSIDGDLSDWNFRLEKYPIQLIHHRGIVPSSKKDFEAFFRVGYNLLNNSIYIAVEVIDDSYVVDRTIAPKWGQQDKHLLYIDPKHSKAGSCPISYSATEIKREIGGSEFSWDPQADHAKWDNVELQISRNGNKTIYEYRIELEHLSSGITLGIDHVIYDKDLEDLGKDRSYVMWGKHAGKSGASKRCGDLVLLETGQQLSKVTGNVTYSNQSLIAEKFITITSEENPDFWITSSLDSLGNYSAQLPKGSYYLNYPDAFIEKEDYEIRIDQSQKLNFILSKENQQIKPFELLQFQKPQLFKTEGILHQFTDFDADSIDIFMKAMMEYYAIPGASLGVIINDELSVHKIYGLKNILTEEPINESTIFQAASITKPVFAYLVLKLSDKGIIDLNRPLYEYLPFPELEDDERYKKMTAKHVITHQTGLPNWGRRLKFEPGTAVGYSGEGFEYLQRVVEEITKRSVLELLDEEILVPMSMTNHTYFVRETEMFAKVALGHHYNLPATNWIINSVGMARSMYTEAKEFSNFVISSAHGKGLKPETFKEMIQPQVSIPFNPENAVSDWKRSFGLGIQIKESPWGKCYSHGGSNAFFQSLYEYYPEKKFGFIIFTNNDMGYHLGNDLRKFLVVGK